MRRRGTLYFITRGERAFVLIKSNTSGYRIISREDDENFPEVTGGGYKDPGQLKRAMAYTDSLRNFGRMRRLNEDAFDEELGNDDNSIWFGSMIKARLLDW